MRRDSCCPHGAAGGTGAEPPRAWRQFQQRGSGLGLRRYPHGINRYARETGIMGELFVENQYRNPEGNPYLWDLIILEAVRAESNISLYLNTDVHEVEASGDGEERMITSVIGWMMGSERRIHFESSFYLDCTGDGLVGFLAGAKFALGREARSEYGEEWAPEVADQITLGSTLLFYTKDAGAPVRYIPPSLPRILHRPAFRFAGSFAAGIPVVITGGLNGAVNMTPFMTMS